MEQGAHALLASWEAFYVIVGPAAAVLIGLQFVVVTLSADLNTRNSAAIRAAKRNDMTASRPPSETARMDLYKAPRPLRRDIRLLPLI